ncbi:MAG TPA: hypothetical protein VH575_09575 [Gemmataceae bacterium]
MAGEHLTGRYRVRATKSAFADVNRMSLHARDRMEIRRQALKLRYWPGGDGGQVVDLDWSWIRTLPGLRVGELRIHDTIAGNDNLRIIFFVGDESEKDPLPLIWVLRVMQKRKNDFTANEVNIFKARRRLVMERFYNN